MRIKVLGLVVSIVFFAIAVTVMIPTLAAGHLTIVDAQTSVTGNSLHAQITVSGIIPIDGNSGAFGYAIATGSLANNVLVLTTHIPIDDSSFEDKLSGFHTHVLDLRSVDAANPTDPCIGQDAEVDVASSQQNAGFDSRNAWRIADNIAYIDNANVNQLNSDTVSGVVAFTLTPLPDAYNPQYLCVDIVGSGAGQ